MAQPQGGGTVPGRAALPAAGGIPTTSPGLQAATNSLIGTNQDSGKLTGLQQELAVRTQIKALVDGISTTNTSELESQKKKNELDLATLELMKTGVTPELAAQLALNQQKNALDLVALESAKARIELELTTAASQLKVVNGVQVETEETKKIKAEREGHLAIINEQISKQPQILQGLDDEHRKTKAIGEAREAFADSQKVQNHMKTLQKDLGDTNGKIVEMATTIENELGGAMSAAATDLISGTGKAEDAFKKMFANIGKAFLDMAAKMIAKALILRALGVLFPGAGAAPGGGMGSQKMFDMNAGGDMGSSGFGMSFAGGGYTGDAPRAGGIDGQGGFPAILHPQETVTDHSRMAGAMQKFKPAGQSAGSMATAENEADAANSANVVDVNYNVTEINSMRFVSEDQFQAGLAMAAKRGAEGGHAKVMGDLINKRSARARIGI